MRVLDEVEDVVEEGGGTVAGPWQTLVSFDIGVPVAGPATGLTARIGVLKLFR